MTVTDANPWNKNRKGIKIVNWNLNWWKERGSRGEHQISTLFHSIFWSTFVTYRGEQSNFRVELPSKLRPN